VEKGEKLQIRKIELKVGKWGSEGIRGMPQAHTGQLGRSVCLYVQYVGHESKLYTFSTSLSIATPIEGHR